MSTAADYLGRTIDLLILYGAQPKGEQLLTQALALPGQGGAVITGIEKLAQRYVLELLTEAGSLVYLPNRGCNFMIDGRSGGWRTQADLTQSFYAAMITVKRALILEEQATDPDDERFGSATLLGSVLNGTQVAIRVALSSLAGTSRVIFTPLLATV